jgi:hypothetical protein
MQFLQQPRRRDVSRMSGLCRDMVSGPRIGLKLPNAIQRGSALAINAVALVSHEQDFAGVRGLRVSG